jgi:hypothetical protein
VSGRIDHVAESERDIEYADATLSDGASDVALAIAAVAQVHATLALVEQQRIANLIALSVPQELIGTDGGTASIPSWMPGAGVELRDDIREGLGL